MYIVIAFMSIIVVSIIEWALHRFIMHRPIGKFRYPFEAHALTHHSIFKADSSYHCSRVEDKRTIPMAWWNGPVLILLATLPSAMLSILFKMPSIAIIFLVVCALYYGAYEWLHWCMHLPKKRRMELSWIFFRLNGHHVLHHRYMKRNFNVVLPLADLLFGTLLLRSKVSFAQVVGPMVPNVQPRLCKE